MDLRFYLFLNYLSIQVFWINKLEMSLRNARESNNILINLERGWIDMKMHFGIQLFERV